MKAIILAADGSEFKLHNTILPKSLLLLDNDVSILERQIRILNLSGFSNKDIIVVIGAKGSWENINIIELKNKISAQLIVNSNNIDNGIKDSLLLALNYINDEDTIIIDGDLVFESNTINKLIEYKKNDIIVTQHLINNQICGYKIYSDTNKIKKITNVINNKENYVSDVYTGISKLSNKLLMKLKDSLNLNHVRNFLDAMSLIVETNEVYCIDYLNLIYGHIDNKKLAGGSYANLHCKLIVRKQASDEGKDKVINEVKWILDLPNNLKKYFPEVLHYDITSDDTAWFEMPFYKGKNLRDLIMIGEYNSNDVIIFLEKLLHWMFNNIYCNKISETPQNWVLDKHINRVFQRLVDSSIKSNILSKLINADEIIINNVKYKNIIFVLSKIARRPKLIKLLTPKELVMIHGDLHFQNILIESINDEGFLLADPRGEMFGSDIYYDLGKLWHCFHGKYDFIHTDQFTLDSKEHMTTPEFTLNITNTLSDCVYDEIHNKILILAQNFTPINKDPNWEMKILFTEACHFCSVMPFHINKASTHDRAVALYLTGVKLINEFYNKFNIDSYEETINYYNINTLEDYIDMIKNFKADKRSKF